MAPGIQFEIWFDSGLHIEVPERKLHQVVVQNLFYIFCWHADSPIEYGRLLGGEKGLLAYCRRAEVHAGWVHDEIRRQFMKVTCRNETLAQLLEVFLGVHLTGGGGRSGLIGDPNFGGSFLG